MEERRRRALRVFEVVDVVRVVLKVKNHEIRSSLKILSMSKVQQKNSGGGVWRSPHRLPSVTCIGAIEPKLCALAKSADCICSRLLEPVRHCVFYFSMLW